MTVRREIAESSGEVHGATDNERHACGRRRDGEPAVSWRTELRGREADSKQSVDAEQRVRPPANMPPKPHVGLSQRRIRNCSRSIH